MPEVQNVAKLLRIILKKQICQQKNEYYIDKLHTVSNTVEWSMYIQLYNTYLDK